MTDLGATPSQTVGPYLAIALPWPDGPDAAADGTPGAIVVAGVMTDGTGEPVPDGIVESWQADPQPRAGFRGFARSCTDQEGRWWIRTLVPGAVDGQAPHLNLNIFARGLLKHVVTRVYFPEQPGNAEDPVLASLPPETRRMLVAQPDGADRYRYDIRLQGEGETPFFEV